MRQEQREMQQRDQPISDDRSSADSPAASDAEPTVAGIRRLLAAQPFAVLCTQGQGQPYGSLVAFAASDDLRHLLFATPSTTRKFRLLRECAEVALVVDSRSKGAEDIMELEAITATGRAAEVPRGCEFAAWEGLLVRRHPYLKSFVSAPSSALFVVEIERYLYVVRFQEAREWMPNS
nr:pyridoxamine 5'-phosphate oxidase family protein [Gammaproteobacteria bacterium]